MAPLARTRGVYGLRLGKISLQPDAIESCPVSHGGLTNTAGQALILPLSCDCWMRE